MSTTTPSAELEVFFDGDCPLCMKEIAFARRLDKKSRVRFTDIAAPGFDAASIGRTQDDLMARIQARTADGSFIDGVEVFRQMYAAVGLAPIVALTRLPGVTQLLDAGYVWFARNRLRLTGRCDDGSCTPRARA